VLSLPAPQVHLLFAFQRIAPTFLVGALAWILPPHLFGNVVKLHPETAWPFVGGAIWNLMPLVSVPLIMLTGFVYGLLVRRHVWVPFLATWWIVFFNIILDISVYPSSHNLLPIELVGFAVFNLPTLLGAWLGKRTALRGKTEPMPH
jgi:hypothetical protein